MSSPDSWPKSDTLADWNLLRPSPTGPAECDEFWGGSRHAAAMERLERFWRSVSDYEEDRNLPSEDGSSRMSPHLHFGEITPRKCGTR